MNPLDGEESFVSHRRWSSYYKFEFLKKKSITCFLFFYKKLRKNSWRYRSILSKYKYKIYRKSEIFLWFQIRFNSPIEQRYETGSEHESENYPFLPFKRKKDSIIINNTTRIGEKKKESIRLQFVQRGGCLIVLHPPRYSRLAMNEASPAGGKLSTHAENICPERDFISRQTKARSRVCAILPFLSLSLSSREWKSWLYRKRGRRLLAGSLHPEAVHVETIGGFFVNGAIRRRLDRIIGFSANISHSIRFPLAFSFFLFSPSNLDRENIGWFESDGWRSIEFLSNDGE